jgi:chromosome segregation ATPase
VAEPDPAPKAVSDSQLIGDEAWVKKQSPTEQVAYRKAKLALSQAEAAYDAAERDAAGKKQKPQKDFDDATKKRDDAAKAKTDAIDEAAAKADDLKTALNAAKPNSTDKPEKVAEQMKKLQAAMDACSAAVAAVAKKHDDLTAAQASLAKLSDPDDPTKADPVAIKLAADQYELDVATADIAWKAAVETFKEARATIQV